MKKMKSAISVELLKLMMHFTFMRSLESFILVVSNVSISSVKKRTRSDGFDMRTVRFVLVAGSINRIPTIDLLTLRAGNIVGVVTSAWWVPKRSRKKQLDAILITLIMVLRIEEQFDCVVKQSQLLLKF